MKNFLTILLMTIFCVANAQQWTGTWATAPQATTENNMPKTVLSNCAVRQIIRVSLGGDVIRLKLSNEYSDGDLTLKSVFIANANDSSDIDKKSITFLTFNGKRNVTIPAGGAVYSDPIKYQLIPLQKLAITTNYRQSPKQITSHPGSRTTSYIIKGVANGSTKFRNAEKIDHWFNIAAIEVSSTGDNAIAILGNSITDGRGSTTNLQNRWTDILATQMEGKVGVLNLGIGGNCVMEGGLGDPARQRFDRDILGQSNINTLIVFEGVNDIGSSKGNSEEVAQRLIESYQQFAVKAHAQGIKVFCATIPPFKNHYYFTFFHEAARQTVNEWIRKTGTEGKFFDGFIDFDELLRAPEDQQQLRKEWQDDWLHPNAEGYKAMGEYAARIIKEFYSKE